ncbi:MAG: hypothetical protein ACRD96_00500 [Bryobacteraceae bacterium]
MTGSVELADSRAPEVRKRRDFSGVVVWLDPVAGAATPARPQTARMLQKGKNFAPHVLAIPVGATVDFPNFDPIFHNAFSNFAGQPFDVGLYAPGSTRNVTFRREGIVRVFCNIHPTMSAVIAVLATPYVAVSGASGAFSIDGVPPGDYRLRVFHERATEKTLLALERRVAIEGATLALPAVSISESGYLQVQHANKYGREYPPVIEDHVMYSGRKR